MMKQSIAHSILVHSLFAFDWMLERVMGLFAVLFILEFFRRHPCVVVAGGQVFKRFSVWEGGLTPSISIPEAG